MKKITCFFYLIFLSCTSTGFASDRPGIDPSGYDGETASSGHDASEITNNESKRDLQGQRQNLIIITPGDGLEMQKLREGKEIHLKFEGREFEGIEPHHFNERDSTIFRQRPDIDR